MARTCHPVACQQTGIGLAVSISFLARLFRFIVYPLGGHKRGALNGTQIAIPPLVATFEYCFPSLSQSSLCVAVLLIVANQRFLFSDCYAEKILTKYVGDYKVTYVALKWIFALTFLQLLSLPLGWKLTTRSTRLRRTTFVLVAISLSFSVISWVRTLKSPEYRPIEQGDRFPLPLETWPQ